MHSLNTMFFAALISLSVFSCNDDDSADVSSDVSPADNDACACPNNVCSEGDCVLTIVLDDNCDAQWGNAQVFINDLSNSAAPAGTVAVGSPFTTCEPFQAPIFDDEGDVVQDPAPFSFVVESEDGRLLSGSSAGMEFTCAGSMPFVWNVGGCN